MVIEQRSYHDYLYKNEGKYIHRYYLPWELREVLQERDMVALNCRIVSLLHGDNTEIEVRNIIGSEPLFIHYKAERLVKEIDFGLLPPAIDACLRYRQDDRDYPPSEGETRILLSLNDRLRQIEWEIHEEAMKLNHEMLQRQQQGEPFLEYFEVDLKINYLLADDDPMSRDDDDNFLYEYERKLTIRKNEKWGKELKYEEERIAADWNDKRPFNTDPLFVVPHSWLFHDLECYSEVPLKHLCRIGTIWVDIKLKKQRWIEREVDKSWDV